MAVPTSGSPIVAAFQRSVQRRNAVNDEQNQLSAQIETPINIPNQTTSSPIEKASTLVTRRRVHNVLTIADRAKVVAWMVNESNINGSRHIISKEVIRFQHLFCSSQKANLQKAIRLWRSRAQYTNEDETMKSSGVSKSITRGTYKGLKRVNLKALCGKGRKTRLWINALHLYMLAEFDRLGKLGVKFNWRTLEILALQLISTSENQSGHKFLLEPSDNRPLSQRITRRWIQNLKEKYRIVSRAQTGKHLLSPQKDEMIHKEVAFHLGNLCRAFRSGQINEDDVENADETHFVINMDNGRTLGFCGEKEVKYSDVVSGGAGMTMVVRISGGRDARIEPVFMVFQNKNHSYPIKGVPDDVPYVSYRCGPKGWVDTVVMPQRLGEQKVISRLPHNRKRILFVDNCSGHNLTIPLAKALENIHTGIRYFPPNATHLVQPADSFVIQKIKNAWNTRWENYKMNKIAQGAWGASGKLKNPGKAYF